MKIIGIDPGLNNCGWSVITQEGQKLSFIASGSIKANPKDDISKRLKTLYNKLSEVVELYQPDIAAIEETFVNKNPMSSLKLGHARGCLITTIAMHNIDIYEYSATKIKKAIVGNGRADKIQIQAMVKILIPKAEFSSHDEADAIAVAICHAHH